MSEMQAGTDVRVTRPDLFGRTGRVAQVRTRYTRRHQAVKVADVHVGGIAGTLAIDVRHLSPADESQNDDDRQA